MSAVREEQRSLGDLFHRLTDETKRLINQEVALAKTEVAEKVSALAKDVAIIAAGGILAYSGFLVLLAATVIGLGHLIGYGFAALLVGAILTAIGAGAAMSAAKKMKSSGVAPTETITQIKETKQWAARQL
jgi:Putative Actinobacterial Holin-X, holin superfamily III